MACPLPIHILKKTSYPRKPPIGAAKIAPMRVVASHCGAMKGQEESY